MHQAKLQDAFKRLPDSLFSDGFEIVDWGCGQGLGTINLFDYLAVKGFENNVKSITLIEPSKKALERAVVHVNAYLEDGCIINQISDYFENINEGQIECKSGKPVIHIFSNILDVAQIDLKRLASLIDNTVVSENYLVCVGPLNPNNLRIDAFYNYFDVPLIYEREEFQLNEKNWTYKCKVYKLEPSTDGNLIPIEFYPSVQFHAAYELDRYKLARKASKSNLLDNFAVFEVAAPFDIGASVYDDVHPIMAVLNNIITRGLPTKASIFLEENFIGNFSKVYRSTILGEIFYLTDDLIDYHFIAKELGNLLAGKDFNSSEIDFLALQEILTPIAVARFQKTIIEAILTGHLDINKDNWSILVEEKDVPIVFVNI
jgi:hypothetical protein